MATANNLTGSFCITTRAKQFDMGLGIVIPPNSTFKLTKFSSYLPLLASLRSHGIRPTFSIGCCVEWPKLLFSCGALTFLKTIVSLF